jgi:hypothetical protein
LFDWIDADKSGKVSFREFKSAMIATWYEKIPAHILSPIEPQPFMTQSDFTKVSV